MTVARVGSITLDCGDPQRLADFWAALLGGEITYSCEKFVTVRLPHLALTAIRVPNHRPPTWPGGDVPKQIHLDLAVDDLDTAEQQAVRLGAESAIDQPAPDRCRVLIDPAGHLFCVCLPRPELRRSQPVDADVADR